MREHPVVSTSFRGDRWYIMVTTYGRTEVAGPRILRAPPHPDIEWSHPEQGQAEAHATLLRNYLAALPARSPSKKKLRQMGS